MAAGVELRTRVLPLGTDVSIDVVDFCHYKHQEACSDLLAAAGAVPPDAERVEYFLSNFVIHCHPLPYIKRRRGFEGGGRAPSS